MMISKLLPIGSVVKLNGTKGSSIGKTRIDTSTYFTPVFEYRYDGQVYTSRRLNWSRLLYS